MERVCIGDCIIIQNLYHTEKLNKELQHKIFSTYFFKNPIKETRNKSNMFKYPLVQAFYRQKSVNLPLIAKEGFLTVFGPGRCPL